MTTNLITLIAIIGVLGIKIFSWYIDKPRRIRELKARIDKLETDLSHALIYNDTIAVSRINRELYRLRQELHTYSK